MHKTKLQPKTLDFESFLLLYYPYSSADNSSPLTKKERCCERERKKHGIEKERHRDCEREPEPWLGHDMWHQKQVNRPLKWLTFFSEI